MSDERSIASNLLTTTREGDYLGIWQFSKKYHVSVEVSWEIEWKWLDGS